MLPVGGHIGKFEQYKLLFRPTFYKGKCFENLQFNIFFHHLVFLKKHLEFCQFFICI